MDVEDYEIDILSPIRGTYQNSNLFYFPKSYKRLEKIVRMYPANKFETIGTLRIRTYPSGKPWG
jgi:hypothetical protein